MAKVTLNKVFKTFDKTEVVHGIDLDIAHKEFLVLVGPSGCGKFATPQHRGRSADGRIRSGGWKTPYFQIYSSPAIRLAECR